MAYELARGHVSSIYEMHPINSEQLQVLRVPWVHATNRGLPQRRKPVIVQMHVGRCPWARRVDMLPLLKGWG